MSVAVPNWYSVDVWKHLCPNVGQLQRLMMSVGLSVGAPKLMTRLPGPQKMNLSRWCTRPMHGSRGTDPHARTRALAHPPFLTTTPPVTMLFRSWNMTANPWAAVHSRVPLRRAAAARERGRSRLARTFGPRSKCRLPSARRSSRSWGPRLRSRRRRSRSSSVLAAELTTRQSGRRQWVFRARAARARRLYRRRARRCVDDRA